MKQFYKIIALYIIAWISLLLIRQFDSGTSGPCSSITMAMIFYIGIYLICLFFFINSLLAIKRKNKTSLVNGLIHLLGFSSLIFLFCLV